MAREKTRHSLIFFWILVPLAVLAVYRPLAHPLDLVRAAAADWRELASSASRDDIVFEQTENTYTRGLITAARSTRGPFRLQPWDGWTEQIATEMALPKLAVATRAELSSVDNDLPLVGPQLAPRDWQKRRPHSDRWWRMLLALVCWIGSTAWIRRMRPALRVLVGAGFTGWTLCLLSLLTRQPLSELYEVWVPLALAGTAYLAVTAAFRHRWPTILSGLWSNSGWVLIVAILPQLVLPFLIGDLRGPDARTMWFYRYKFEFLVGFIPKEIVAHMMVWAQRDYPWFLGGAVGIASWRDRVSYGGWFENAAYGSLLWLVLAFVALFWWALRRFPLVLRISALILTFGALNVFVTNGYMDVFWISSFALFLFADVSRTERWCLLALACSFKNEGVAACVVYLLLNRAMGWRQALFWLSATAGTLAQKWYLQSWGITDQYRLGSRVFELSVHEMLRRFDTANRFLVKEVLLARPAYGVPLVLLVAYGFLHRAFGRSLKTLGVFYLFCLPAILSWTLTRQPDEWAHIETSAYRVYMMLPFFAVLAPLAFRRKLV